MKIRRGIIKSRQASILGGGVTGWHSRRRFRKVLIKRERESNDGRNVKERERKREERERVAKGREKHQHRLREVLIYRDAGTLRLRLTANLRVNSLGDKLAELRRKYSWHYAYA